MSRRRSRSAAGPRVDHEWIATQTALDGLIAQAAEAERIAVDTEFHRERTYYPRLAVLQLRVGDRIGLIDPLEVDLTGLADALERPLVVMHAASQDLEVLDLTCGRVPSRIFDTQIAAGFVGLATPSLASLVEKYLGLRLPKGDRLTDWFERPLGDAQRQYAASDVAHLFELHDVLSGELDRRGRTGWADAEFVLSRVPGRPSLDPELAWTRIKEARHLRGPARSVAAALAEWRELSARDGDVPVRFVLSDLALVGIAQKRPRDVDQLRSVRGVDGRFLRNGAASEILDQVKRGVDRPSSAVATLAERPGPGLDAELRAAVTLVSAWVSQLARDSDLDPALLATRNDINDFLRGAPDARLSTGWRAELAGEPIRDLVEGRAALAFDRGHGLVLEPRTQ